MARTKTLTLGRDRERRDREDPGPRFDARDVAEEPERAERERAQRLAVALGPQAVVWPKLDLGALSDRLATCAGVVGVDSGLSHIATALDRPHVQVYNFDTAWRTGPVGRPRQVCVFASPTPSVDAVWQAWEQVRAAA